MRLKVDLIKAVREIIPIDTEILEKLYNKTQCVLEDTPQDLDPNNILIRSIAEEQLGLFDKTIHLMQMVEQYGNKLDEGTILIDATNIRIELKETSAVNKDIVCSFLKNFEL